MNIVIVNRWKDEFANYKATVNHKLNNVIYITNKSGSEYLANISEPYTHYEIDSLEDIEVLIGIIEEVVLKFGNVDRLVALSEFDIKNAGILRSYFKIEGMKKSVAENFTNKIAMKSALKDFGVVYPKYTRNSEDVLAGKLKFPIVQKPCEGAASEGVLVINDMSTFKKELFKANSGEYDYEEFIEGDIYHVDGIKNGNTLQFMKISRYINSCYEYEKFKKPLGSIIVDDCKLHKKVYLMTLKVLNCLGMDKGVFHLEFILHNNLPVFLEVGARQGGGEIVPLMRNIYGVDLVAVLLKCQLLENIDYIVEQKNDLCGGFLLFPEPVNVPVVVKDKTVFGNLLKTLVYEITPPIGQVLNGDGGYYFNAGRFLFIGSKEMVEKDLAYVIKNYEVKYE